MHECKIFKGSAVCPALSSDDYGETSEFVTHRIDAFGRHDQHADGAFDNFLHINQTFRNRILLVHQCRYKLRLVDVSAAHFQEMGIAVAEEHLDELVGVIDFTYCCDGIIAEMRTND